MVRGGLRYKRMLGKGEGVGERGRGRWVVAKGLSEGGC